MAMIDSEIEDNFVPPPYSKLQQGNKLSINKKHGGWRLSQKSNFLEHEHLPMLENGDEKGANSSPKLLHTWAFKK